MHKHYNGYKMKKASLFDRDNVIAFVALLLVVAVIGFAVGSCCKGEDQLATCWIMCKPGDKTKDRPGSRVSVRMEPSKKSPEIGFLECGDSFQTDGESVDGWISCLGVGETNGWIYCGYVCTEKPEIIGERYVCVAKKQVACRKWMGGPKIEDKPWLKNGQNVQVYASDGEWAITNRGYIKAEYLEVDPE
jgi:hypothetical protein